MPTSTVTTFSYSGSIVDYTVPTTGLYVITSIGAGGGALYGSSAGGLGAEVSAAVMLTAGEVLQIAVGGAGAGSSYGFPGGGGGGSFVVGPGDTPLEVAGGGGGGAYLGAGGDATGIGSPGDGSGGSSGADYSAGGGGGGLLGDGGTGSGDGLGGAGFTDGAAGGLGAYDYGNGGFGGGGGGGDDGYVSGGGGGGGYTGGTGGDAQNLFGSPNEGEPGAGGTSFASGTSQQVTLDASAGNGLVTIAPYVAGAPVISGTTELATTDEATVDPFPSVTVTDSDITQAETVSITYTGLNGTFTDPNAATDGSSAGDGTYTVIGTAAQVQADLEALVFTPTAHQVTPGDSVTTDFSLSVANAIATTVDPATSVTATAVNDAPLVSGTVGDQLATVGVPIYPFAGVTITDPDVGATDAIWIAVQDSQGNVSDSYGTLSGAGLSETEPPGFYVLSGDTPAELTSQLDALSFTPAVAGTVTYFGLDLFQAAGNTATAESNDKTTSVDVPDNVIDGPADGGGVLEGVPGINILTAYGESNQIFGHGGDDTIIAGSGGALVDLTSDDATVALGDGGGANTVVAGDGNVTVTGAPATTTLVSLGNGTDMVNIGGSGDTVLLGNGNDTVVMAEGLAFIRTGDGNDSITLAGSGNTVYAGGGNNEIQGSSGGADTFVLSPAGSGFDSIAGFIKTNGDILDLRIALSATTWNGNAATLANYLTVTDSGGNTDLAIAPTGSGVAVPIATLLGAGNLTLADLLGHNALKTS